nr:hypothetical protein CFP56_04791 [Quercus suber]
MKAASELKDYLEYIYSVVAQYDTPSDYPVTTVCKGIDGGANGTDILGRIFSGVVAYHRERSHCLDILGTRADEIEWLIAQRKEEVKIIKQWLSTTRICIGSHCLDILGTRANYLKWLTAQRKEVKIIKKWLHKFA